MRRRIDKDASVVVLYLPGGHVCCEYGAVVGRVNIISQDLSSRGLGLLAW